MVGDRRGQRRWAAVKQHAGDRLEYAERPVVRSPLPPHSLVTEAAFSVADTYVLQLTASDTALSTSAGVTRDRH